MRRTRTSDIDEALVRLWNEIEPLRLAGDVRGLREVERAAARIAREGDEAQRRDAERLLETLRRIEEHEGSTAPATARLDAEVAMAGRTFRDAASELDRRRDVVAAPEPFDPGGQLEDSEAEAEERPRGLRRLLPLVWVIVFVVVIVLNILGSRE